MATATKYESYPKYKSSGIDWLGDIPAGWEVKRLKNIIEPLQSGGRESESVNLDGGVLSIGGEHVGWNGEILLENPRYISREYYLQMNQGKIKENDVLLVKDGATIGKTALIDKSFSEDAAVNEHVFIIRANNKNTPKYLYYFIISKIGQEQIFLEMRGSAQPGLNSGFIGKSFLFAPPKDEQKQITDFLDCETAKIDGVVAKKQKLIELLKEKRQALITHAVTKGLDPKAKMKPSGIDWIGKIPVGWQVKRLKYISNTRVSNVDKKSEDEIPVKLCNYIDVYKNEFIAEKIDFMIATATRGQLGTFELKNGDVIMTKDSETPDDIGVPAYVNLKDTKNIVCGYHLAISTPNKSILFGKYLFRLLQSSFFRAYFEIHSNGITRFGLDTYSIFNANIPLPLLSEQRTIADFLDRETGKIDGVIKKVETQIEKLQEYRQALISNAVTGKIKI